MTESSDQTIQLVLLCLSALFAGAALIFAFVPFLRHSREFKRGERLGFLNRQVRELYGPAFALVQQSDEAYRNYLALWAADPQGEQAPEYLRTNLLPLHRKLFETCNDHLDLIDPDDIVLITAFFRDYYRIQMEADSLDGLHETPEGKATESEPLISPQLHERFDRKFKEKEKELLNAMKMK